MVGFARAYQVSAREGGGANFGSPCTDDITYKKFAHLRHSFTSRQYLIALLMENFLGKKRNTAETRLATKVFAPLARSMDL